MTQPYKAAELLRVILCMFLTAMLSSRSCGEASHATPAMACRLISLAGQPQLCILYGFCTAWLAADDATRNKREQ